MTNYTMRTRGGYHLAGFCRPGTSYFSRVWRRPRFLGSAVPGRYLSRFRAGEPPCILSNLGADRRPGPPSQAGLSHIAGCDCVHGDIVSLPCKSHRKHYQTRGEVCMLLFMCGGVSRVMRLPLSGDVKNSNSAWRQRRIPSQPTGNHS